jgi:transposase
VFWVVAAWLLRNIGAVSIKELLAVFFRHLGRVCVDQVFHAEASIRTRASAATDEAECPNCGTSSRRRHGHYERRLPDAAVGSQELLIHLRVHRFLCRNAACHKQTSVEQVPGLTVRYGRRSRSRAITSRSAGRTKARSLSWRPCASGCWRNEPD